MLNVKKYADVVFCVPNKNTSIYLSCIINVAENETAVYVRGDDQYNFSGRQIIEKIMPIILLPYTNGVSSTQLRNDKYSHIKADDMEYLANNS